MPLKKSCTKKTEMRVKNKKEGEWGIKSLITGSQREKNKKKTETRKGRTNTCTRK